MDDPLQDRAKYASQHLLLHLAQHPETLEEPLTRSLEGSVLFADMQNFTVLAEKLNREDPARGVKKLAGYLDIYIGRLVDIITENGGDIVKFAGDAVFALWEEEPGLSLVDALRAAIHCGLQVQKQLHKFEVAPGVVLALRVGVSVGRLNELHLGGYRDRWEYLLAGAPMTLAGRAGTLAEPGQVILAPKAIALLEERGHGKRTSDQKYIIPQIDSQPARPLKRLSIAPEAMEAFKVYVPRALLVGGADIEAELRPVTVLFCKIRGSGFSVSSSLAIMQIIMLIMQECIYRFEGSINRLGVDEKGAILLAAFGLPPLVHTDDAVRGIRAAQDIRRALEAIGHDASIGVSTGRAFCGTVGNDTRCEYTMHGVNVNLAARLMVHADTILVDDHTREAAEGQFQFEEQPPMRVKNIEVPIRTYCPL